MTDELVLCSNQAIEHESTYIVVIGEYGKRYGILLPYLQISCNYLVVVINYLMLFFSVSLKCISLLCVAL